MTLALSISKKIEQLAMRFTKRFPLLRPFIRWVRQVVSRLIYCLIYCLFNRIEPKVILFESFLGRSYSESPRAIYEYLLTDPRFADYTFVWSFRDPKEKQKIAELSRAKCVCFRSAEYYKFCAAAGAWVSNGRVITGIVRRKKQRYIQTWHGTPFKRLCYDIPGGNNAMNNRKELRKKYDNDTKQYTALLSYSPFTTEKFRSAFALDKLGMRHVLKETGAPRNDCLVRAKSSDTERRKARLGIPIGKKVILYAPTWRDNQHDARIGYTYRNELDFAALRAVLGDEYVVLFRAHYHVASRFDFAAHAGFVIDASGEDDIAELYLAADLLITDYSSVFFDYMILDRPILFYMYDLEEYRDELRGFYITLDELPGGISTTTEQLIADIRRAEKGGVVPAEKLAAFRERFLCLEDGKASRRAAELLLI
ncbi:MAG: CDP-glycerol glycerophosphotransferase family protein [Oscillospiraceae bacterium]|nr:CDP-glycerol glycerophosphotransferase family protein [Oscillospiraceae bacterium]